MDYDDTTTAEIRHQERLRCWSWGATGLGRTARLLRFRGWWLFHNLVVHPLLALVPTRRVVALHDWASWKLLAPGFEEYDRHFDWRRHAAVPLIRRRFWWILHNLFVHVAIGLVPCATTFRWHDLTAARMDVPDWM